MSTSTRFQRHNSTLIWTVFATMAAIFGMACTDMVVAYAEPAATVCAECAAIQSQLETQFPVRLEGPWQAEELRLLQTALQKAAHFTGGYDTYWQAIEAAKLNEEISAERLHLLRRDEGRASYQQGTEVFRILIGDDVFAPDNYLFVPLESRPQALGLRNAAASAEMTMLHELMHVLIDGRPDAMEAFCTARDWDTTDNPVGHGPLDERQTIATASLHSSHGAEEDLATAMALYAYAYAPDAPGHYSYYMNTMFRFHMKFVQVQWHHVENNSTPAASQATIEEVPVCRSNSCAGL